VSNRGRYDKGVGAHKNITGEVAAKGLDGQNCYPQEYVKVLSDAGFDADTGKGGSWDQVFRKREGTTPAQK
jgi:hypothetical protein